VEGVKRRIVVNKRNPWSIVVTFLMVIALSVSQLSCSSGGGGGGGATSSSGSSPDTSTDGGGGTDVPSGIDAYGKAMKGVLKNATLKIYVLSEDGGKGAVLASTTTDAAGEYVLADIAASSTGCYLFEVSGGTYTDEITGVSIAMQSSDLLSAVVCDLSTDPNVVAITPLTTMAASRAMALAEGGAPLGTAVSTSNVGIARQYGLDDILETLPADPTDSADVQTAFRSRQYYGIVIAAMAQLADTEGARAIDLAAALAEDAEDGSLDGFNGTTAVSLPLIAGTSAELNPTAGTADMQSSIDGFLASSLNETYVTDFDIASDPVEVGLNTAGRVYVSSTQLPALTSNQYSSIQLAAAGGTPGYTWQLESGSLPGGLSLGTDGLIQGFAPSLSAGTSMSISAPFTVRVTDSANPPSTSTIELRITTVEAGPTILTPACDPATQYQAYSCQAASANGGSPPYYYVLDSGNFPPMGLVLGTGGTVSGTPTVAGTHTFRVCAVDLVGAQNCGNVTIQVIPADGTFDLVATKTGNGSGTISSSSAGIDCGADCSEAFDYGTYVLLTATPDQGSTFVGWSGPCSGTGSCPVVMNSDWTVTAEFKDSTDCSGSYSNVSSGDGGCTYYSDGTLSMSITVIDGSFSGTAYADGIQILETSNNCAYYGDTSSSGTVAGTVSGNNYSGSFVFPWSVPAGSGTFTMDWTGALSGGTLSGTFTGGDSGSFNLTCQ
jgi:hypothetical protein